MPFTLVKGTFHVTGYSPDGDSLKFKANNKSHWKKIKGKKVRPNSKGHVQLRVEGIDSLETHYGTSPKTHQPLKLANEATDQLLDFLKISNVVWGLSRGRVTSSNDGTKGYILARKTGPYGRPICFLFAGTRSTKDGSDLFLDTALLKKSLNYQMLSVGHAYPLFYETLFFDLRNVLAKATGKSRSSKKGIWKYDKSNKWIDGTNISALENKSPIFPKLFRRLIDHKKSGQPFSMLTERLANEKITVIPTVHHTHFDTIVEVQGKKVRMTEKPENLVIGTVIR